MATIVNNPGDGNGGNQAGWIIAIVAIVVLLLLALFAFGGDDEVRDAADNLPQQAQQVQERVDNAAPAVINTFNSTTTVNSTTTNP